MESSDTPANKKTLLEELSKDDLIKKCNNLLLIAKKAKQAKDESLEELKKYKENETKLSSDVAALKEIVESFNKKQSEFAEVQNKHKLCEEKNSELKRDFQKLEEKYASKITECSKLEQTLSNLSDKLSSLEISNSEYVDKLKDFKENYAKVDIENKINTQKIREYERSESDLRKKLKLAEEKYIKLELNLKEFQGKYIEECKNHEELQETLLRLQTKNSSGRCSSRSSDSLRPVYENQEYDEILDKYNDLMEKNKLNVMEIENVSKKLEESDKLVKELSDKYNDLLSNYQKIPQNWDEILIENEKLHKELIESEKEIQNLKEKELNLEKLVAEQKDKNQSLIDHTLVLENETLKKKVKDLENLSSELEVKLGNNMNQHEKLIKDFDQCQLALNTVKTEFGQENETNNKKIEELTMLLNSRNDLLSMKSLENQELTDKLMKLKDLKRELCAITKIGESLPNVDEINYESLGDMEQLLFLVKQTDKVVKEQNEKLQAKLVENKNLLGKLEEKEKLIVQLQKNYDSVMLEKDKLIEMCDKSTEEILNQNILHLKKELITMREENDLADKRYKEMVQKLELSRNISECLKKEIDGKCDEYEAFKKEMEFYKKQNDELNQIIILKEKEFSSLKSTCEELKKAEKEKLNLIEVLKKDLEIANETLRKSEENSGILALLNDVGKDKLNLQTHYLLVNNDERVEIPIDTLQSYISHEGKIDSVQLIKDLTDLNMQKKENTSQNLYKNNQGFTEVHEGYMPNQGNEVALLEKMDVAEKRNYDDRKSSYLDDGLHHRIISLCHLVEEIKSMKIQLYADLKDHFIIIRKDHGRIVQDITRNISEVFYNLQSGHSELLGEMNDMNQVLKERGEVISKLEKINESQRKELLDADTKISQLENKLSEKKNKMKKISDLFKEVKMDLESKDKTIKEMEEEIWKLKSSDPPGETLSCSTLSRVEETARLMDVEESFEDRYSKLKVICVKLKKKVAEQQQQLEDERNKSLTKSNEFREKIANFQSQIKSLMTLQGEYDRLQDLYEEEKKDKSLLKKDIEIAHEEICSLKQSIEDLTKEKDQFLNDKNGLKNIKQKLSAQIITLKACVEEEKAKQSKLEKELDKLEHDKSTLEKKLEEEKEKHKATVVQLEKQKMEIKNFGCLKLELAEYEKSVNDLEKKLSIQEDSVKELNCLLENQRSQCKLYLDEISHLKSQLTEENERATEASIKMKRFNEESNSKEIEFKEKIHEIATLKTALEEKKRELEEISMEFSKISQEKLKAEEKFNNLQDHSSREVHSLKDTVASLQESLNQRDLELSELKKEFDAYKIRAQSVLRQSQKEMNQNKQRNVIEELEQLRSTSESLKARLEESGLKMQKLIEENEVFQEEKNRLYSRIQELKNSLNSLRIESQELKESKQKDLENHNEALRLQKLQSETLAHCFQKKIEELEASHKDQLEELTKECEKKLKNFQKEVLKGNERRDYIDNKRNSSGFIPVKADKEILDVMLLEREECEGSESVDSVSPKANNGTNLIPLEQLLNSPDHLEQSDGKGSVEQDIHQIKEKLEKSENRIKHLTVLLSEAETDCARLQHLNDVLKEEIRRNQRNVEREQHAQNFEYMKNVVLKFISLHNTDEKIRLVPVLNTILKLSPEEEIILTNAAKGILEHSNANRGWGSYLNIWPSTQ